MNAASAAFGILAVVVLTVGTGFFVAQEFAYVAADRAELRRRAEGGDRGATRALKVTRRLSFMLSGAQLGITITTLLVGFIANPALSAVLSPVLDPLGMPSGVDKTVTLILGFVIATGIQMVVGELVPKNWGIAEPERVAVLLGRPTLAYLKVMGPLIRMFDNLANRLVRALGIEPVEEIHGGATTEELGHIVAEADRSGELAPELSDMLQRAIAFGDLTVDQVMVPRPDVIRVRADTSAAGLIALVQQCGHSHYPVVGDRVDDIVGVVGVTDLLKVAPEDADTVTVGSLARPPLLVPDTASMPSLLDQLRAVDEEFAIVLDEHGGLAGIVTYEDVAEELVGEIADETDTESVVDACPEDGWWRLDAVLRVDEVERIIGTDLPEGPYDTLGGLVIARLGRLPEVGDRVTVPDPDEDAEDAARTAVVEIEVLTVERHVPELVRVRTHLPVAWEASDDAAANAAAGTAEPARGGMEHAA
ncbi:hemolysin family protein [Yinghuangia sp. ASG 101]|uniref:hemolysin family protein n=1 Tax=Yinghuangia sp. ASG 101 TaxID=2896848 RepID=UPI001E6187C9|nr:hemolysin family protein [Yinghuangia sp. ASG 101]UGQ13117.1 hemolysin family protein [Yinghuangia sp. ASG 101]